MSPRTNDNINGDGEIAIVTGANSGLGFGICQRLIEQRPKCTVILACRNKSRANIARQKLIEMYPNSQFHVIDGCDTLDLDSIYSTCAKIRKNYSHINFLFANAGAGPFTGINWPKAIFDILTNLHKGTTFPQYKLQEKGCMSKDGLGWAFQCNFFGHYVMFRELQDLLSKGKGKIIWSSSVEATSSAFNVKDWQGLESSTPYEASKALTDVLGIGMNEVNSPVNISPIRSIVTDPGIVGTQIMAEHTPFHLDKLRLVAFYLARWTGSIYHTIHPYDGAIANVECALKNNVVTRLKYGSRCTWSGNPYTESSQVDFYNQSVAFDLIQKCEEIKVQFDKKYK